MDYDLCSSPVRTAISIVNQSFIKKIPGFTPNNVKPGIFLYYLKFSVDGLSSYHII